MAKQIKAFKFRLYPSAEQKRFLSNQFGASRFVYNFFLANRKTEYQTNKRSLNYYDDARSLTSLKDQDGYEWLNTINAQTLQASLRNLETAYTNFFAKRANFPRFHIKRNDECIKFPQNFKVENGLLYIPNYAKNQESRSSYQRNKYYQIKSSVCISPKPALVNISFLFNVK